MIDEGETDWKVLAIDVEDPLASSLNDVADIEKVMPGFLADTVRWFKIYKMPDGKYCISSLLRVYRSLLSIVLQYHKNQCSAIQYVHTI